MILKINELLSNTLHVESFVNKMCAQSNVVVIKAETDVLGLVWHNAGANIFPM